MVKELGENLALGSQGDVLALPLLRGAVPGEVEGVDGVGLGQGGDDLAPDVGGKGGAMDHHERGSSPEDVPAHPTVGRNVLHTQRPTVHRLRSPLRFGPAPRMMAGEFPSVHILGVSPRPRGTLGFYELRRILIHELRRTPSRNCLKRGGCVLTRYSSIHEKTILDRS